MANTTHLPASATRTFRLKGTRMNRIEDGPTVPSLHDSLVAVTAATSANLLCARYGSTSIRFERLWSWTPRFTEQVSAPLPGFLPMTIMGLSCIHCRIKLTHSCRCFVR